MKTQEQAKNLIEKAKNIFVLLPQEPQSDSFGAALALFHFLKKLGKSPNLALSEIPEKLKFLPIPDYLTSLKNKRLFVISLNNSDNNISEIRYEKSDTKLKIYLATENEAFDSKNVLFETQILEPDLLMCLGGQSYASFDNFFEENPKIFYEKPVLNIDDSPENENFGEINLVEITSSGSSEIIANLLKIFYPDLVDENIATCLLAGIISATQNFQNSKTSPKNLELTSWLIEKGAQHQKIIQYFYKTNSLPSLKLLGQVLEKLNYSKEKEMFWVCLAENDFKESQSSPKNLKNVLEELRLRFLNSSSLLLLWESHGSAKLTRGILYSSKTDLTNKILRNYEGEQKGKGVLFLVRNPDLNKAREDIFTVLD